MSMIRRLAASAVLLFISTVDAAAGTAPELPPIAAGEITYVDFWASWCTPCAQSFPWLNQMQKKYTSRGLRVVGVGVDTDEKNANRFLSAHPAQFSIVLDPQGQLAERFKAQGMPYSVILDSAGTVLHSHVGFDSGLVDEYEKAIEAALAAKGEQR